MQHIHTYLRAIIHTMKLYCFTVRTHGRSKLKCWWTQLFHLKQFSLLFFLKSSKLFFFSPKCRFMAKDIFAPGIPGFVHCTQCAKLMVYIYECFACLRRESDCFISFGYIVCMRASVWMPKLTHPIDWWSVIQYVQKLSHCNDNKSFY